MAKSKKTSKQKSSLRDRLALKIQNLMGKVSLPEKDIDTEKVIGFMEALMSSKEALPALLYSLITARHLQQANINRVKRYKDYEDMTLRVPEIQSALWIYSDNMLQRNYEGNIYWIETKVPAIKNIGQSFFKRVKIDKWLWPIAHDLVKYGDVFVQLLVDDSEKNIIGFKLHNPKTIIKLQDGQKVYGYIKMIDVRKEASFMSIGQMYANMLQASLSEQHFVKAIITAMKLYSGAQVVDKNDSSVKWLRQNKTAIKMFSPKQMVHFSLSQQQTFFPYGTSTLEACRRIVRQLLMVELALVIYRITRAPERRMFTIEVGNLPIARVGDFLRKFKARIKREKILTDEGAISSMPDLITQQDDYYIPQKMGTPLYSVETTTPGQLMNRIEDINYLHNKLTAALRIPKPYLTWEEDAPNRATLSQIDIRFAKIIERFQRDLAGGLEEILKVQLEYLGKEHYNRHFEVKFFCSSQAWESSQIEFQEKRLGVAATYKDMEFPLIWIYRNVMKMTEDEITEMLADKQAEEEAKMERQKKNMELGGVDDSDGSFG